VKQLRSQGRQPGGLRLRLEMAGVWVLGGCEARGLRSLVVPGLSGEGIWEFTGFRV